MIEIDDKIVSLDILREAFACDLGKCKGICCVEGDSGAPLDIDEVDILEEEWENYAPYMTEEGRKAIDEQGFMVVDADGDYTTGWNGYDYILNRSRNGSTVTVEKFVDNEWKFETVGTAAYALEDNTLTVQVEDSLVELTGRTTFDFKAADNSVTDGDILKFMTLGDTAPDNRFAFRYQE